MNPNLRILIVDDDQRMTHTLADIPSLAGHQAVEAASGPQAFDCVLTDVRMPGMNGVEFCRQLRQSQPGLPCLEAIHRLRAALRGFSILIP